MNRVVGVLVVALFVAAPPAVEAQEHQHGSPYAGIGDREIKALSERDVEGLLQGEGMGMVLPAELHGFPGPRHVLELRVELAHLQAHLALHPVLTGEQRERYARLRGYAPNWR